MSAGQEAEVAMDAKTAQERRVPPEAEKAAAEPADATAKGGISWRAAAQAAIIGIFLIMFWGALEFARPVLLPIVSAIVVGLMLGRLTARATELGIPQSITAIVLMALVIGMFYAIIVLLSAPVVEWVGKAPEVGNLLRQKLYFLDRPLAALEDLRKALSPQGGATLKVDTGTDLVAPMITVVTPAIGQIVVFFGTLFFFLLGRNDLRRYLVVFFDKRESRLRTLRILNDVEHQLTSYLSVVAVINACVGIFAGIAVYLIGYPNPPAFAVLAFVLNFIPYLGPLIMEVVLFGVGLVTFPTLQQALIAPLVFLAFTTLEGHFITPMIMGARLTLAPITVFIALVFWTWLWGPVGAFLAVPLLIVGLVTMQHLYPEDNTLPG
jgi:predicted PurR-regulated permease PerM